MKISSIVGTGGLALFGLLFGVLLTFELIRFELIPGVSTQSGYNWGDSRRGSASRPPRQARERRHEAERERSQNQRPSKSSTVNLSTSAADYPDKYGLSRMNGGSRAAVSSHNIASSTSPSQLYQQQSGNTRDQPATVIAAPVHGSGHRPSVIERRSDGKKECKYDFKVYVYDLPPHLASVKYAEEARKSRSLHICQKCILEQFSLEYIVTDFLTQFCGRTYNPEEADYFYLPIIRDAEYRVTLDPSNQEMKGKNRRASSQTEEALLQMMGDKKPQRPGGGDNGDPTLWKSYFNITDKWWNRRQGMDHIIAMPAPVTNLRHEGSMRGHFHYMMHLHTPIFLNVEYSRSFINDYPICAKRKNIVMPYPTTDPGLFNGKLHSDPVDRHSLLYYAGGMHGECVGIRRAIRQVMMNGTRIKSSHITPKYRSNQQEREHGMRSATFCPIPVGDSPSSKRMYDVLHFGCVPVILSDELVYAYSNFSGGPLDDLQFSIRLPQSIIQFPTDYLLRKFGSPKARKLFGHLPDGTSLWALLEQSASLPAYEEGIYINPLVHILRMVSQKNLKILKDNVARVERYYRYYEMDKTMQIIPTAGKKLPDGGAIEMFARALSKRKREGIVAIGKACQEERFRPGHKYNGRYPCDRDNANSLMGALN